MTDCFRQAALLSVIATAFLGGGALAADDLYDFDIPAGNAEEAIAAFSEQSHKLILAPGAALAGVRTPALQGHLTTGQALAILLKDTGLQIASDDGRSIILRRAPAPAAQPEPVVHALPSETIVVTGYRASLADSTSAKRAASGFADSVFAEEIGKFPDTNIAEALNRIPGVTIFREINGEGVNVQIRGLGTNFTKILLNGNPIAIASTGITDATNTNREVDLNMFPMELFTQLTVAKTLSADQIEGGAAGTVTLRSMRPFDKPGFHLSYNLQATDQTTTNLAIGKRGALIVSDTEGPFGLLIGIAGVQSNMMVRGWEDGNAGWVTSNLPAGVCGAGNTCGQFGGGAWTIPANIPQGVFVPVPDGFSLAPGYSTVALNGKSYFPAGYPVSAAMLYALNPALADSGCAPVQTCINQAMTRLSNTLLPRLGRPMFEKGSRDRYNAIVSFEYFPSDNLHFYTDLIFGRVENHMDRDSIDWGVRGGNSSTQMIPADLVISPDWLKASYTSGLGGAARSGTFYNATNGLEARAYRERGDFVSINPGLRWELTDRAEINFQAYYTRSHFLRTNPTVMVTTCTASTPAAGIDNCPNGPPPLGTVLSFDASGVYPTQRMNLDLNDPRNYEWNLGRATLNGERRMTYTLGAHLDVRYGTDALALKLGAAYDEGYRIIAVFEATPDWQAQICGDYPSAVVLNPNTPQPGCTGQVNAVPGGWTWPAYTGWGTGYTAGAAPLSFKGSLVPTSALVNYLKPGSVGFPTVNYDKIFADSNFWPLWHAAYQATACIPHCRNPGYPANTVTYPGTANMFDERNVGLYGKLFGEVRMFARRLKYDVGLRWVQTRQTIISPERIVDPRNSSLQDGGQYPDYFQLVWGKGGYDAILPSASLVYELTEDFQTRLVVSRTLNRPNPNAMSSVMTFSDPSVTTATLGNPDLKPYFSANIDAGVEYYTGNEGVVGLAYFRKSISGFPAQLTTSRPFSYLAQYGITWASLSQQQQLNFQTNGGASGVPCDSDASCADHPVAVNQQVNLPGLEIINGIEVDYVQPLDALLEPFGLEGFGMMGNLTLIGQRSTGSVPTYAAGVAPLQYNVTGYYERDGVMVRLSYNWNDSSYNSSSNNQNVCFPANASGIRPTGCPAGSYLFNSAYGQADLSSSLSLAHLFGALPGDPQLTFDVQNLFGAKQSTYGMLPDMAHSYYIKGQTILLGLRGSF